MNQYKNQQIVIYLLVIIFLSLAITSCKKETTPLVGDEFIFQNKNNTFTTYKVVKKEKQNLWYIVNNYEVSEQIYIDSIFALNQYTDDSIQIKRKDFKELNLTFFKNSLTQRPK